MGGSQVSRQRVCIAKLLRVEPTGPLEGGGLMEYGRVRKRERKEDRE